MRLGFYTIFKTDPQHFLHAASLVREARQRMPDCEIVQLTDAATPLVPRAHRASRIDSKAPMLDQRIMHYATCEGEWLLVDTDVSIRNSVSGVFDDKVFDVALCDRNWPHLPQGDTVMHRIPFNTGVVFSRSAQFWAAVLTVWRSFPEAVQKDWLSEQQAVYEVVRTGRYRVKILPGMFYNYPPTDGAVIPLAALVHYKGPRKSELTKHAYRVLGKPALEPSCV